METKTTNLSAIIHEVIEDNSDYYLKLSNEELWRIPKKILGEARPLCGDKVRLKKARNGVICDFYLNNKEIYHFDSDQKEEIIKNKEYIKLHPLLKKVVDNAIANQEISNHSPYDTLILCVEATKVANKLKTRQEIERFAMHSPNRQLKKVPELLPNMDSLQRMAICAYAYLLVRAHTNEALIAQRNGAHTRS